MFPSHRRVIPLSDAQRSHFDHLLEELIDELPEHLWEVLEVVPLIVEDEPTDSLMQEMDLDREMDELYGLHWGIPLTDRSLEHHPGVPDRLMIFRGPILRMVGHRRDKLREQIRITLLHEIGHHFGLDEDDLAELGYG